VIGEGRGETEREKVCKEKDSGELSEGVSKRYRKRRKGFQKRKRRAFVSRIWGVVREWWRKLVKGES